MLQSTWRKDSAWYIYVTRFCLERWSLIFFPFVQEFIKFICILFISCCIAYCNIYISCFLITLFETQNIPQAFRVSKPADTNYMETLERPNFLHFVTCFRSKQVHRLWLFYLFCFCLSLIITKLRTQSFVKKGTYLTSSLGNCKLLCS